MLRVVRASLVCTLRGLPRMLAQRRGSSFFDEVHRMKRLLLYMLLVSLLAACSPAFGRKESRSGVDEVSVDVFGWDTYAGAVLIDKTGRRAGSISWRAVREIPGCRVNFGSEFGIPDQSDTTSVTSNETPAPLYHHFTLRDSASVHGIVHDGTCELQLAPASSGKVALTLLASGVGLSPAKDTLSTWVTSGATSRWLLSWRTDNGRCVVKMSEVLGK